MIQTQTPTQTQSLSQTQSRPQTTTEQVLAIRIEDFLIDAKQPRRYLPADLREQAARPHASGLVIMQALLARAAEGDLEASGYIADLQSLAEDIGQIKVQQPVQVSLVQHDGRNRYMLIDGERRYWACLYLAAQKNIAVDKLRRMTIPAIIKTDAQTMSADELERVQWSLNGYRCDMSYIELACRVRDLYRSVYAQVVADRHSARLELGYAPDDDVQDNEVAVQLAAKQVEAQTGRALSPRTIFDYLGYAEKLTDHAQALARAYHFGVRDLARLARMEAETQEAEVEALVRTTSAAVSDSPAKPISLPASKPEIGGRPTRAQRSVNICVGLIGHIAHVLPRLERFKPDELQEMHGAAQQAEASLVQYRHSIEMLLNREKG